jgi:hypothetical protein
LPYVKRRIDREPIFECDGYEIEVRATVGDRATLTFLYEGDVIGKVAGVRLDPEVSLASSRARWTFSRVLKWSGPAAPFQPFEGVGVSEDFLTPPN